MQQTQKNNVEEARPTKTKTVAKAKAKAQHDLDNELTKAEMKEMADIDNQFYAPLNRINKIPSLKEKLTKGILRYKKAHLKVNDQIIKMEDSNYIIIEVI